MKTIHCFVLALGAALTGTTQAGTNAPPGVRLTGTVVDAQGQPVSGVIVECYQYGPGQSVFNVLEARQCVTFGTNGSFEFSGVSGLVTLLTRKPGLAPAWSSIIRASSRDQRLVLGTPGTLAGVVVDQAGQPVAGAEVSVAMAYGGTERNGQRSYDFLSGKLAHDCFNARTGSDGRFHIEGFPTHASADLAVKAPGKVLRQERRGGISPDSMQCRAGDRNIRLVVEPSGSIEGKVVAQKAGQPIAGARLTLEADGPGFVGLEDRKLAESGADGVFRISDVAAGSYRVQTRFGTNTVQEWVADSMPVSVESGRATRGLQISAVRGGLLEVAVFGKPDRKPLGQVEITAFLRTFNSDAVSDNNVVALLRLLPGSYQVSACKEGWTTENSSATVETGTTNHVAIELAPPPRITGVVRQPNGQPAAGLPVRIVGRFPPPEASIETDANGRFETEWGTRRIGSGGTTPCLLVRDAERNLAVAQDIEDEAGPLNLTLAPGLTIVGRVECDGKPVSNASPALVFWTRHSGMALSGLATGTNVPGHFEIRALPPGRRYGVVVSAPGYGQRSIHDLEIENEAKRIELDPVKLKPANLKLAGQVLDADDKPVAGVFVSLSGEGQPYANMHTDREGKFTFDHVCEGTAQLFASARNLEGNISVVGGDTNIVLKLSQELSTVAGADSEPHKLTGTVIRPDGQPAVGAQVAVFPFGGSRGEKTGTNGAFHLTRSRRSWLSGKELLFVRDIARNLVATEELSEDATNLTVRLKPGLVLAGRIESANHAPLAKAEVGAWLRLSNMFSQLDDQLTATDAEGRFEIKSLPMGARFRIFAKAKGYGQSRQEISADGETNRVELAPLVLKLADKILAGQVVNSEDKPVAGVRVSFSGEDQPQDSVTTDSKGRFTLMVCEGRVQLSASARSGNARATAKAGDTNVVLHLVRYESSMRQPARRASLKGNPLPDLAAFGLGPDAAPANRPLLLCLFDLEQRPSRRMVGLLAEQHDALRQKGIAVVAVQATVVTAEALQTWKEASPVPFPVGRVAEKTGQTKWASDVASMPWLILTDAERRVAAEGFPLEDLEAQAKAVLK